MIKVSGREILEFAYDSLREREDHVAEMIKKGYRDEGRQRRLKPGISIINATQDDYEYFSELVKYF